MIASDLEAETERLLAGRTRDINLTGEMLRLYMEKSWRQRSKIARAWAVWVSVIGLTFVHIDYLSAPSAARWPAVVVSVFVTPIANLCVFLVWRKPRSAWTEELSIFLMIVVMMIAFGVVGVASGGVALERYMPGALLVGEIAIMVFGVKFPWALAMAAAVSAIYGTFAAFNPYMDTRIAVGACMFYAMATLAIVMARRTVLILFHKSFLLSLRDDYRSAALTRANRKLELLATRDPLTGLANRRSAADHVAKIWRDPTVARTGVAFVMADIDHFKRLNDAAGHAAGDECLTRVARSIEASVRSGIDVVCRHGGEEFLIVLNGVTPDMAWTLAERIRGGVEALGIVNSGVDLMNGSAGMVTISVGVAFAQHGVEPELVAKWADDALYDAKHGGRNRVFMSAARMLDQRPVEAITASDLADARL